VEVLSSQAIDAIVDIRSSDDEKLEFQVSQNSSHQARMDDFHRAWAPRFFQHFWSMYVEWSKRASAIIGQIIPQ